MRLTVFLAVILLTPNPSLAEENEVELGKDELTAGIPGEGELTIEQIQAWLGKSEVHSEFTPVLPYGLSAAQACRTFANRPCAVDASALEDASLSSFSLA